MLALVAFGWSVHAEAAKTRRAITFGIEPAGQTRTRGVVPRLAQTLATTLAAPVLTNYFLAILLLAIPLILPWLRPVLLALAWEHPTM